MGLCVEPASNNDNVGAFVIYYSAVVLNMAVAGYLIHKSFSKNVTSNSANRDRV